MVGGQIVTGDGGNRFDGSLRATRVRMVLSVEKLEQDLGGADRRIVLILPQPVDRFGPALRNLRLGKHRTADRVEDDRQDVIEILGEAGATDGGRMPRGQDAKRNATLVELLGNDVRRS